MCFAIGAHGASQGQTTCFQAAPSQTTAKHGIRKIREFQGTKNGGDFNTKKCWFYRGRGQILTLGPFLGLQGLKHSLSLRDGFFPSKPPFSHLQAGPFQDVPVLARFLGARKTLLSFSFPFTSLLAIW